MPAALRTLLIGGGKAGNRFLRALRYGECAERFQVVALVDLDAERLAATVGDHHSYTDLNRALRREKPDVAVVCVNEEFHFGVLDEVLAASSVRHVACEKPLTQTLDEFRTLAPQARGVPVSVNFCERYSSVIGDCAAWLAREAAVVTRLEFWWGKYRVRDARPTMGVLSELSHPLDLARYLLGASPQTPLRLASATTTRSDFSSYSGCVPDSVNLVADLGECLVVGNSSFVWEERRRRLVLYAQRPADGRAWQLVLDFDNPAWDDDTFSVYELEPVGGKRVEVGRTTYRAADIPAAARHVDKIYRYLIDVADTLSGAPGHRYADIDDALWAQVTLDDIGRRGHETTGHAHAQLFAPQASRAAAPAPQPAATGSARA